MKRFWARISRQANRPERRRQIDATPFREGDRFPMRGLWWEVRKVGPLEVRIEVINLTGGAYKKAGIKRR